MRKDSEPRLIDLIRPTGFMKNPYPYRGNDGNAYSCYEDLKRANTAYLCRLYPLKIEIIKNLFT